MDAAVPHRFDNVCQTSGNSEQVTNINLGDPNATTNIVGNHNRPATQTAKSHDTSVAETVDSMANTQGNGAENAFILPVQQDMGLHVEATTELRLSDHGLIGTQPSHSQRRSNVYGHHPLVTNSYVPRRSLWMNNSVPAGTSTSITTTNSASNNTVGTITNVVSTTTVYPQNPHFCHYGKTPFSTQTPVGPNTHQLGLPQVSFPPLDLLLLLLTSHSLESRFKTWWKP